MFVNGEEPLEVGKTYTRSVSDGHRRYHDLTFIVIRIATEREYRQWVKENTPIPLIESQIAPYFYKILTD